MLYRVLFAPWAQGVTAWWDEKWECRDPISSSLFCLIPANIFLRYFPIDEWDETGAGQVCAGEMGRGCALCPKATIPAFPWGNSWPLSLVWSCGCPQAAWDWPLSLPAAFLTSGNTGKTGNAGMGLVGLSSWTWSSIKTAKPPNCPSGLVWAPQDPALAELGLLGWNRWGKHSPKLPELCQGGQQTGVGSAGGHNTSLVCLGA